MVYFQCVVHPPLAISVKAFRRMLPDPVLPPAFIKTLLQHLLLSLDYLYTEVKVMRTGKSKPKRGTDHSTHQVSLSRLLSKHARRSPRKQHITRDE